MSRKAGKNKPTAGPNPPLPQRTIQVKIGNQAAKEMTPDQAADYLKLIAAATSGGSGKRVNGGGGGAGAGGAQVKMTFQNHGTEATLDFGTSGPYGGSLTGGGSVTGHASSTTTTITWGTSSSSGTGDSKKKGRSFGASTSGSGIKSSGAAHSIKSTESYAAGFRLGQSVSQKPTTSSFNNNSNNNMPCTEKEMKALMSMFVEIMGLQMNTDKLNQTAAQTFQRPLGLRGKTVPKRDVLEKLWHHKEDLKDAANDPEDLLAALEYGPPPYDQESINPKSTKKQETKGNTRETAGNKSSKEFSTDRYSLIGSDNQDEHDDCDSLTGLPDLEVAPLSELRKRSRTRGDELNEFHRNMVTSYSLPNPHNYVLKEGPRSCVVCGIAVPEWETLERMAMEDALEQEERARKAATAAKRKVWRPLSGTARALDNAAFLDYNQHDYQFGMGSGSMSNIKYPSTNPIISGGGGDIGPSNVHLGPSNVPSPKKENNKQLAKKCTAWRNRVVAACHSGNVPVLKEALDPETYECPLQGLSQWQPLLVHVLPKQRLPLGLKYDEKDIEKSKETSARHILLRYLLDTVDPLWFLRPDTRSGRSVLHSACFLGDVDTVQSITQAVPDNAVEPWNEMCHESGWSCLFYAAVAGASLRIVELLLRRGIGISSTTSDAHTWLRQTGQGATVAQFLQYAVDGTVSKYVESHGMAWSELQKEVAHHPRQYQTAWRLILKRIQQSTSPFLKESDIVEFEQLVHEAGVKEERERLEAEAEQKAESVAPDAEDMKTAQSTEDDQRFTTGNGKPNAKNKKKKQQVNQESQPSGAGTTSIAVKHDGVESDPLTQLLVGMGFEQDPVVEAIRALGGPNTATPDTVIAWLLDHPASGDSDQDKKLPASTSTEEWPVLEVSKAGDAATISRKNSRAGGKQQQPSLNKNVNKQQQASVDKQDKIPALSAEEQRMLAKREEQRRRNREWNKKQEEAAAANLKKTPPPAPTIKPAPPPIPQAGPVAPIVSSSSSWYCVGSNDISTLASSEGAPNDDATISTIESTRTTPQPLLLLSGFPGVLQQQTSSAAPPPPGFGAGPTDPAVPSNNMRLSSGPVTVRPPGIPESHPILEDGGEGGMPGNPFLGMSTASHHIGPPPHVVPHFGYHGGSIELGVVAGEGNFLPSGDTGGTGILNGHPISTTTMMPDLTPQHQSHDALGANLQSDLGQYHQQYDHGDPCGLFHTSSAGGGARGSPGILDTMPESIPDSAAASLFSGAGGAFGSPPHGAVPPEGFFAQHRQQQQQASSIMGTAVASPGLVGAPSGLLLDSISTGGTGLVGSSLWGDSHLRVSSSSGGGGDRSFLLGNVIPNDEPTDTGFSSVLFGTAPVTGGSHGTATWGAPVQSHTMKHGENTGSRHSIW